MNTVTCYKESGFPLLPEITIKNEQNKVVVRKVPMDGEFARFGVKEGDIIESVNGISFKGFDNNKVFSTLSVMTGELKIVFSAGGVVKEPLSKSKRKLKESSNASKDETNGEKPKFPESKVKKEPKTTSKRKKSTNDNNPTLDINSEKQSLNETSIENEIESILDNSKRRKSARGKVRKELIFNTRKEESTLEVEHAPKRELSIKEEAPSTALEECPECDEKFNVIEDLSQHYTEKHTVVHEEEDVTPIKQFSPLKKSKRKSGKKDFIKTETISVSEHFQNDLVVEKNELHDTEKDEFFTLEKRYAVAEKDSSLKGEEIQKLHEKINSMKVKFSSFKNDRIELIELKKKTESSKDLELSLRGLKEEVDKKYEEMSDMKRMILNTEEQLVNERTSNKKEKDRNKALTEEIKKLKRNQSELQKKFKEADNKNREIIAKECKEMDDATEKNEKFKEMEEDIVFLNQKVDQLTHENDSLVEENLKVAGKEKEVLQNAIDEKIIEVEELKNEKSLSKMKIRKLEKEMEVFKTNTEEIQSKIASMNSDRDSENKELKGNVETQKVKIQELEKDFKVTNEKSNRYKRDVSKLMEKISRKEDVIEELNKEKKIVNNDEEKKGQIEKKVKTYQDTILQKSGIISKLEEENQKLLKEKIENFPFAEEKKKTRFLEENLRKVERKNRELNEKFRLIELEIEDKKIKDKIEHHQDIIKTNEIENKLKDLEKESISHEEKIKMLTIEKENLVETLKNSTMEAEEKNLLNILKTDVKSLEATNELNLEKIISLEMDNEMFKSGTKDKDVVTLQEGIRDLKRENEEMKLKYKDLEDENRDTLNDQMQNLKAMVHLKDKNANLKDKKRDLKEDLEQQTRKTDKLKSKNKVLQKEVNHMSQLQVELKSLKQKIGSKKEVSEIILDEEKPVSKWEADSDSSSEEEGHEGDEDWDYVNEAIEDLIDKKKNKSKCSDVSDDENDFDTTKFIELAKTKTSETETSPSDSNNVSLKMNTTPKVNASVRKAIANMLETKEPDVKIETAAKEDLDIRRTFGDKFADKFSLREKDTKADRIDRREKINDRKSFPLAPPRGYEGNNFYKRDIDIRNDARNRQFSSSYRRDKSYNERSGGRRRGFPGGGFENFNRATERDRDVRSFPYERRAHDRRNSNDPRRWKQEDRSFSAKQKCTGEEKPFLSHSDFYKLEQIKAKAAKISSSFPSTDRSPSVDKSTERSPSVDNDKPSTSTVNNAVIAAQGKEGDDAKAKVMAELSAQIKQIRNIQTEAKFVERNIDMTESSDNYFQDKKHALEVEDGEIEDFRNKKLRQNEGATSVIPKFRLSKESRSEIRTL